MTADGGRRRHPGGASAGDRGNERERRERRGPGERGACRHGARTPGSCARFPCHNRHMVRDLQRPLREAWIVDAVRTPIGRYGGALARRPPRRPGGRRDRARSSTGRASTPPPSRTSCSAAPTGAGEDNRNVARMARAARRAARSRSRARPSTGCAARGCRRSTRRPTRSAPGDGDVFIAGGVESMTRAPYVMLKAEGAWDRGAADDGGHDARLAVREPPDAGGLPADLAGRDRRVRRRPVDRLARAPGRVRAREPAARGRGDRGGPVRRPAGPGQRAGPQGRRHAWSTATSIPAPTRRPRRSRRSSPRSGRAGRSPRATARASTTAPRRCCWSRRSARARWGCGRWRGSSRRRSPASTPT